MSNAGDSQPQKHGGLNCDAPLAVGEAPGTIYDRHDIGRDAAFTGAGIGIRRPGTSIVAPRDVAPGKPDATATMDVLAEMASQSANPGMGVLSWRSKVVACHCDVVPDEDHGQQQPEHRAAKPSTTS